MALQSVRRLLPRLSGDQPELYLPNHVDQLLEFAGEKNALAIPHHLAYARGWRGANFDHFSPRTSPVVEIFSEHGCSESVARDGRRLYPPLDGRTRRAKTRSNASSPRGCDSALWPRATTISAIRERMGRAGRRVGTRRFGGRTRRSDSQAADLRRHGGPHSTRLHCQRATDGLRTQQTSQRQIDVRVASPDSIKSIELVRNGRVIHRHFPENTAQRPAAIPGRVHCRVRYGWGPWGALDLGRICDWELKIYLQGGRFLNAIPCFQTAPFDEQRRDRLQIVSDQELHLVSHTSRVGAYDEDPTKAIVLAIDVERDDAELTVELMKPSDQRETIALKLLQDDNTIYFTGGFTAESFLAERLIGPTETTARLTWHDPRPDRTAADWYYVRVLQHNNHMAWSSPVWVG